MTLAFNALFVPKVSVSLSQTWRQRKKNWDDKTKTKCTLCMAIEWFFASFRFRISDAKAFPAVRHAGWAQPDPPARRLLRVNNATKHATWIQPADHSSTGRQNFSSTRKEFCRHDQGPALIFFFLFNNENIPKPLSSVSDFLYYLMIFFSLEISTEENESANFVRAARQ